MLECPQQFHGAPTMLRNAAAFLLVLLAMALPQAAPAFGPLTTYVAYLNGYIDIAPDGSVQDYSLTPKLADDNSLKHALDRRIRSWRFEPITDNGHPVVAHVLFGITLQADTKAGSEDLVVTIGKVDFYNPPLPPDSSDQTVQVIDKAVDKLMAALTPPHYPARALRSGVGASVDVLFDLDDNGRILAADIGKMDLLLPYALTQVAAAKYAEDFRNATLLVARNWTFPPNYRTTCGKPCLIRIPVRYSIPDTFWSGLQPIPVPALLWAAPQAPIVGLDPSGAQPSARKLIDPAQAEGQL
jgi:outer membrane biosynthesis protein TonB